MRRALDAAARALLPPRCLVCGDDGEAGIDLCTACRDALPWNDAACARCGVPLPLPAAACGRCLRHPPPFTSTFAILRYEPPIDVLLPRFKFTGALAPGRLLARLMGERVAELRGHIDVVAPVPLHASRLARRGYNQALELARPIAATLDAPLRVALLQRTRATAAQTHLDRDARRRNVRDAFAAQRCDGLRVLLVDDVMTTGATLASAAAALRRGGAAAVHVAVAARAPPPR